MPALQGEVSAWLLSEWPDWYGDTGPGDLAGDVAAFARSESLLPVGFVVFEADRAVGFAALKQTSIPGQEHLSPWAAAAFVVPAHRGRGIGAFLLRALVEHAKAIGFDPVYCGTSTAVSLLQREGWHPVEQVVLAGTPLSIFRSRT